jgi:capping protein (actin filament) muscle Z-line, alpha
LNARAVIGDVSPLRRSELESSTLQYLSSHYNDGTASVFAMPDDETHFTIQIVANKYNPVNFW